VFFASLAASMANGAARSASAASGEGAVMASNGYFVDSLFRTDNPATNWNDSSVRAEAGPILANALRHPDVPGQDRTYLAQLVAASTGLSQADAEKRVDDTVAAARQAADDARKSAAHMLYWLFVALLIGAFCASFAATIGGRQRDYVHV
jgi:hypothetical protein